MAKGPVPFAILHTIIPSTWQRIRRAGPRPGRAPACPENRQAAWAARAPGVRRRDPVLQRRDPPGAALRAAVPRNALLAMILSERAGKCLPGPVWGRLGPERGMYLAFRRDDVLKTHRVKNGHRRKNFFGDVKKARLGAIPGLYCPRF